MHCAYVWQFDVKGNFSEMAPRFVGQLVKCSLTEGILAQRRNDTMMLQRFDIIVTL